MQKNTRETEKSRLAVCMVQVSTGFMASSNDLWVAVVRVDLLIPGARSLKDKRMAVRSLKERLRVKFELACSEVGDLESWNRASLGMSAVSNEQHYLKELVAEIGRYVQNDANVQVTGVEKDITSYPVNG